MPLYQDDMCLLSGPFSDGGDAQAATKLQISTPKCVYPATKSQEGMWIEFQSNPSSTKYNITLEWDLLKNRPGSRLGIETVLRVIRILTKRHAVLRSMFTVIDHKPYLEEYSADGADPEISIVYRDDSIVGELEMTAILRRPFLLDNGFPARWVILHDLEAFRVYIICHHIIVDGQSMTNISTEFLEILDHPEATLPPVVAFHTMHMTERAWARSSHYLDHQKVLLSQARRKNNTQWPKASKINGKSDSNYRQIDSWCSFQKSDLEKWSQMFKTSWFRVATTLASLLVIDQTRPQFGKDEVVSVGFGSRPKEMSACVGQFANALPVRVPLWDVLQTGDGTFKALVSAVGKNISAVKKSELFPAVDVVRSCRQLNIDYEPPRVAVTYSPKLAKSECRLFPVEGSWDLFFCFLEDENDVKLGVIYNPQVFSGAAISDMKTQFDHLSALGMMEGTKLVDMLEWLPRYPNLPKVLVEGQQNPLRHVHHWFEAHAESRPEALAMLSRELGTSMTYRDLHLSSEKKAQFLKTHHINRGDRVLLHLPRGFLILEWILAILKCGAAFVYLDPDFTEYQKTAVTENCKPKLVVDELLNNEAGSPTDDPDTAENNEAYYTADDDLAYIIYTSGSTGEPKGVMVEHGSLATFVKASTNVFEVGFGTRVLQLASFSFDASILEWTAALCSGACLCFAQYPKQLVGEYLGEVIERNEVTFMEITPTALETLPVNMSLPSLRQISIGGEAPSYETFAKWHPRVNLINAYGPTEAAIAVSFNMFDKSENLPPIISAGYPNPEVNVYICAPGFGSILGRNSEGEICVSGPQIARGYCEKPDITEKCFSIHPATGVRMYRTGDRGMLLDDGSLLVMGRMDREVKVRGFRIAPEEVEGAIIDAGVGVQEASVQLSESGLELIAFVAPVGVSSDVLLNTLKDTLPNYKVPSRIFVVDNLPKNVSGKINHKAVLAARRELTSAGDSSSPKSVEIDSYEDTDSSEDWNSAENQRIVVGIWQRVLGITSPPLDVNFFDIGGHSLLVPQLHNELKAAFPLVGIRVVDLFHKSTIRSQTLLIEGERKPRVARRPARKPINTPSSTRSEASETRNPAPMAEKKLASSCENHPTPDVAIVGISGRFPGAQNVDEFYQLLKDGKSGIRDSKSASERQVLPGNIWVARAGALDNVEDFDSEFWNLTEEEATEMDPQQRLFMEVAYEALIDSGTDIQAMDSERIGLFVGSANPGYHLHTESVVKDPFLRENRGFVAPSISARTAYHLNIRGPNATIQTNCASSTIALSQAFDAIRTGRCDMAIVGGVSVQLYEGGYITQNGQIFSPRGECNPFDSRADGTVPADAVTAVVLMRYSDAVEARTPVYSKILGTGIGSDGSFDKAGYQVPSPRGQADVIKSAWKIAGLTASRLKYAEIHGSGTPIGDALELEGLSLAVKELGGDQHFTVGSTKGNIGNAQHSSGLVSLIKLCKSMQAGVVPATKGLEETNRMINPDLPVILAKKETSLGNDDILAVSASGWGGVNSHIVLGFPDAKLLKKSTKMVRNGTFNRKSLKAPRLKPQIEPEENAKVSPAALVFSKCASQVLGMDVEPDTDLKRLGMDSKLFIALMAAASESLSGPTVGIRGFLLPTCTPSALASIYEEQISSSAMINTSSTDIPDNN